MSRVTYRNFTTKSVLPLGPILRVYSNSYWGMTCTYMKYAAYIKKVNRNRRPKGKHRLCM